jgi:thymidylate synthase (FAD)
MRVRLIAYTQPVVEGLNSVNDFIAYVARVSNPGNQLNTETSGRLLKYLIKHSHWSPFEMAHATMEIVTTRDIARQIIRHRSFSFQEFSQRYAIAEDFVKREARLQDAKNRQNSIEISDPELQAQWRYYQERAIRSAKMAYDWALSAGIAKEQARAVLPEGLTESTLYMSGSIRSWIHYIELRSGPETQKEHREIAVECERELNKIFKVE